MLRKFRCICVAKRECLIIGVTCCLLWAISVMSPGEAKHFHSFAGPFRIVVRRLESCQQKTDLKGAEFTFHEARRHRTQKPTYTGMLTLNFTFNETIQTRLNMDSWSNVAGWRQNAQVLNFGKACKLYAFFPSLIDDVYINIFGHRTTGCFLLGGFYRFSNLTIDLEKLNIKVSVYGRYRVHVQFLDSNSKVLACWTSLLDALPA